MIDPTIVIKKTVGYFYNLLRVICCACVFVCVCVCVCIILVYFDMLPDVVIFSTLTFDYCEYMTQKYQGLVLPMVVV